MHIKIKHIKKSLLILACIFFAGFNYFTYVKADNATSGTQKTCDKAIDSDCDGLTNAEEKLYGTDPNNADTDGDGYSDGVEVKSGYDPLKPAPGDKIITSTNQANSIISSENYTPQTATPSQTDSFVQDFKTFIASKGDTTISNADVNDFVTQNLAAKTGSRITLDSLPEIDQSQIKILPQNYGTLSAADKKSKMQQDVMTYYSKIAYILASNAPTPIITDSDLETFKQDFFDHFSTLASANPDYAYFSDLGNRSDMVLSQVGGIEVPESILALHIKALRIIKGFLALRDNSNSVNDPIAQMALLSKIKDLTNLTTDFFAGDFQNYNNSL